MSEADSPGRYERVWLEDSGVPTQAFDAIQDAFGSVFEAADAAYRGDDRVEEVHGVGEATAARLADLSPLDPPGAWEATKTDRGGYRFHTADAEVWLAPDGDRWETGAAYDGTEPFDTWQVDLDIERSRVAAWWAVRNAMEDNPDGPGSAVPRNVDAPEDWRRTTNHGDTAVWAHEESTLHVRASTSEGEPWTLTVSWERPGKTTRHDWVTLATGSRRRVIGLVPGVLDTAAYIVAVHRDGWSG